LTALAGWVEREPTPNSAEKCRDILRGQAVFGHAQPQVHSIPGSAFGISIYPALPEDEVSRQPLADGSWMFVADARLDNRAEIAEALGLSGHLFSQLSDAALLFRAWIRFGDDCLSRVLGDFALAAWSSDGRRLSLARDPTGQRPLFYAQHANGIAFASMPFGLLACEELRRGFDHTALANVLLELPRSGDEFYLRGIRRVMPGEVVTYQSGVASSRRYWSPSLEPDTSQSFDANIAAYRELIDNAVKSRLRRRDGPIACHLSSGLDSNAVTATAGRLRADGEELIAFTAAPREDFSTELPRMKIADEAPLAALAARYYGARHVIIRTRGSAVGHVRHQAALYQDPKRNVINAGWLAAIDERARGLGANILLTGDLGNLTINAGNISQLADFVRAGEWLRWSREAFAARRNNFRWRNILFTSFGWRLPANFYNEIRRLYLHERSPLELAFVRPEIARIYAPSAGNVGAPSGDSYRDRLDFLTALDFGTERKGALSESGIDVRDPTADRRLIEFSFTVPPDHLFRNGIPRSLAREALVKRVPAQILNSKVRGHQAADWFEHVSIAEISEMIQEIATSPTARELIDFRAIEAAISKWPDRNFHRSDILARFAGFLPVTLATGYFILEAERQMRAHPSPHPR
jgi:asparagine synthase (glutamine-hydrolysing)